MNTAMPTITTRICIHTAEVSSGAAGGPAGPALAEPLFAGQLNFPLWVITSKPNFQVFPSTNHTRPFLSQNVHLE